MNETFLHLKMQNLIYGKYSKKKTKIPDFHNCKRKVLRVI